MHVCVPLQFECICPLLAYYLFADSYKPLTIFEKQQKEKNCKQQQMSAVKKLSKIGFSYQKLINYV